MKLPLDKATVVMGDAASDQLLVLSGVPQGSVLDLALCVLISSLESTVSLFAHDTKMYTTIYSVAVAYRGGSR